MQPACSVSTSCCACCASPGWHGHYAWLNDYAALFLATHHLHALPASVHCLRLRGAKKSCICRPRCDCAILQCCKMDCWLATLAKQHGCQARVETCHQDDFVTCPVCPPTSVGLMPTPPLAGSNAHILQPRQLRHMHPSTMQTALLRKPCSSFRAARPRTAAPCRLLVRAAIKDRPAASSPKEHLARNLPFISPSDDSSSHEELNASLDSFHGSCWDLEWVLPPSGQQHHSCAQGAAWLDAALQRWSSTYTNLGVQSLSMVSNEDSNDAFIYFSTDVLNTGSFAGNSPSQQLSSLLGLYRVHLNEAGQPQDVWLYRSGTKEERKHLLKQTGNFKKEVDLSSWQSLKPCSWSVEPGYAANIQMRAGLWADRVMSRNCLSTLVDVSSPQLELVDGTGLLYEPCQGIVAVGHHLMDRALAWDLSPRKVLANVVEPNGNKVFQHWKQDAVCRATGRICPQQGASLLVFDSHALLHQVLEFVEPHKVVRDQLFRDDADLQALLDCWAGAGGAAVAGQQQQMMDPDALAREQAECLARQEREWMSW